MSLIFFPDGRNPFYGDFYTTALLSGCVDTHMDFNNQMQCKLMKYTIPISERLVIIFLFFSGEFLLNPYIWGFGGGGFFCCVFFFCQEPVSASSQPNLNLFQ